MGTDQSRVSSFLDGLVSAHDYEGQIVARKTLPARPADYAEPAAPFSSAILRVLATQGIDRLYTHQAEAIDRARRGENVVVVTSTASGKTLCYNIPVMEQLLACPRDRALYVFPTKALAQDQLRKLRELDVESLLTFETYDGDTKPSRRRDIRRHSHVILTNPDMLHVGILPNHAAWAEFFTRLRYIVVDEVHSYRGVFGCHAANVFRRLRRIAAHYGANPTFVACSATIANPLPLVESLVGVPFSLVDNDGSPKSRKHFVVWNPPLLERSTPGDATRRSAYRETAALLAELIRLGIRTIVFVRARKIAELVLRRCRNALPDEFTGREDVLMPYRGGYLPEERREIERRLFNGELLGVCSTTALEVGVDIGGLDACIMAGYPGSIASLWQQAGRAGRSGEESLAVLVALGSALDQYLARNPDYLFSAPSEQATVDPENRYILAGHLLCAANELPLDDSEAELFGGTMAELLAALSEHQYVAKRGQWFYTGGIDPAPEVSIRSAEGQAYDIVQERTDAVLGNVDSKTAFYHVHEGAIYLHLGETYRVQRLDIANRRAYVVPVTVDYYTEPQSVSEVSVGEELAQRPFGSGVWRVCYGEVCAETRVISYRRLHESSGAPLEVSPLDLPPQSYETCGFWIPVPPEAVRQAEGRGYNVFGAMHGIEHAMIAMLPLYAMCEALDLAGASQIGHRDTGLSTIFVYDAYPGGVGICERAFERLEDVIAAALSVLRQCPCESGCPACVQSPFCGSNNQPMDKRGAAALLASMLGEREGDSG